MRIIYYADKFFFIFSFLFFLHLALQIVCNDVRDGKDNCIVNAHPPHVGKIIVYSHQIIRNKKS